jgi:periplasmic divalent cation tolerance protein
MKLVIVSCGPGEAERLLDSLLEERLVGCGNILPSVRSHYWWEGRICRDEESLLLMETEEDRLPRLLERVPELHSYDVPKVIALEVTDALPAYQRWLRGVLG